MSDRPGTWQEPEIINGLRLWVDANNELRAKTTPPTSDTDGSVIIGGPGMNTAVARTAAQVKTYAEDADIEVVYVFPGSYSFSANPSMTPTQETKIIGLGGPGAVQFDWSGAVGGHMIKASATTGVVIKGIEFLQTGNYYYILPGTDSVMKDCILADNARIGHWPHGNTNVFLENINGGYLDLYADTLFAVNCNFVLVFAREGADHIHFNNCCIDGSNANSRLYIWGNASSAVDRDITWIGGRIKGGSSANSCIDVAYSSAGAGSAIRNVKFIGVTFQPENAADPIVVIENDANLEMQDWTFVGCTFRDCAEVFNVGANATVTRLTISAPVYDNCTARDAGTGTYSDARIDDGDEYSKLNSDTTINALGPFNLFIDASLASVALTLPGTHVKRVVITRTDSTVANDVTITDGSTTWYLKTESRAVFKAEDTGWYPTAMELD